MRKRVPRPTKPDCYNARIITRFGDGGTVVIDFVNVPAAIYRKHFGADAIQALLDDDTAASPVPPATTERGTK